MLERILELPTRLYDRTLDPTVQEAFPGALSVYRSSPKEATRVAPMPPTDWGIGHLRHAVVDTLPYLLKVQREYGDVVRLHIATRLVHLISDPEMLETVFQKRHRLYLRDRFGSRQLQLVFGQGLLTSEGEHHHKQRRLMQPVFRQSQVEGFASVMAEEADELLRSLVVERPIDLHRAMTGVTLQVVTRALMGTGLSARETDEVGEAVTYVLDRISRRSSVPVTVPLFVPTRGNRRFLAHRDRLDEIVFRIIGERRRGGVFGDDLLGRLMSAEDPEREGRMSDEQLRSEVLTMFLAGHETTAATLTWALYLLAKHPEADARLYEEIVRATAEGPIGLDAFERMPFNRAVILEALRLYPPAWAISRSPIEDDVLHGYFIPKNSSIVASPYVVQRHPAYFERPDEFLPERFLDGGERGFPRFAFFPFGGGPRLCIGREFALVEAQLLLATIARRFRFRLPSDRPANLDVSVTLRPKNGLWALPVAR